MINSSTIGYNLPIVDRSLQLKTKRSVQQVRLQVSTLPVTTVSTQSIVSPSAGGLLSSTNVAEALKLTDPSPLQRFASEKPLTDHNTLLDALKQSKAYASGDVSIIGSLTDRFTSKDTALIRATTGYNIVSKNNMTTFVEDDGNPPPAGISDQVWKMADSIGMARSAGFKDELTPENVRGIFTGFSNVGTPLPTEWLGRALDYLRSTDEAKPKTA